MKNGMDALIVYDDLSKQAVAYRQIPRPEAPIWCEAYQVTSSTCTAASSARSAETTKRLADRIPIIETQACFRHPDQRDLYHRRSGLPRNGPLQSGGFAPVPSVFPFLVLDPPRRSRRSRRSRVVKLQLAQYATRRSLSSAPIWMPRPSRSSTAVHVSSSSSSKPLSTRSCRSAVVAHLAVQAATSTRST